MRPTRTDVVILVYTLGAVLSGSLMGAQIGSADRVLTVAVSAAIAAVWTGYFRFRMLPRLKDELTEDSPVRGAD
jgi:divalent metal cation (Fe/Co/Zn/Cd) transporter